MDRRLRVTRCARNGEPFGSSYITTTPAPVIPGFEQVATTPPPVTGVPRGGGALRGLHRGVLGCDYFWGIDAWVVDICIPSSHTMHTWESHLMQSHLA